MLQRNLLELDISNCNFHYWNFLKFLHQSNFFPNLDTLIMNKSSLNLPTSILDYDFEVNSYFRVFSIIGAPLQKSKALQIYLSKIQKISVLKIDDEQLDLLQNQFFINFLVLNKGMVTDIYFRTQNDLNSQNYLSIKRT